jgi:hypothetical protein
MRHYDGEPASACNLAMSFCLTPYLAVSDRSTAWCLPACLDILYARQYVRSSDSLVVLIRRRLGEQEVASGVECGHVEESPWSGVDISCIGFLG